MQVLCAHPYRYRRHVGAVQVYVHHYVSSSKFILGSGAELRGSFHRRPLERPYALVVDTADLKNVTSRHAPVRHCVFL